EPLAIDRRENTMLDDRPAEMLTLRLSKDQVERLVAQLRNLGRTQADVNLVWTLRGRNPRFHDSLDVALTIDPGARQVRRLRVRVMLWPGAADEDEPAPAAFVDGLRERIGT